MADLSSTLNQITQNLDDRRYQLRQVERVVTGVVGGTLEHTAVTMAIPMVYAHWEGYVKEVCQLYLEYIEYWVLRTYALAPVLLGYLWSPVLKRLVGGADTTRRNAVAERVVQSLNGPVEFSDSEKSVNTKSNLDFNQLEQIAEQLCIDITSLSVHRNLINSLVHIRNNIAHGSIPNRLTLLDLTPKVNSTVSLMEDFEKQIVDALHRRLFFR